MVATKVRFLCDLNRSGRRYLERKPCDGKTIRYPISLWSFIIFRINYCIKLHEDVYQAGKCTRYDDESVQNNHEENIRRRSSLIYYLLSNGGLVDCRNSKISSKERKENSQKENVQTMSDIYNTTSSFEKNTDDTREQKRQRR